MLRSLTLPLVLSLVALSSGCSERNPPEPDLPDAGNGLAEGELCDDDSACDSGYCGSDGCLRSACVTDDDCGAFVCQSSSVTGRTCEEPHREGDECNRWDDTGSFRLRACEEGLACETVSSGFDGFGLCLPPQGERTFGQPCTDGDALAPCAEELECFTFPTFPEAGTCRKSADVRCQNDAECASRTCTPDSLCANHACAPLGLIDDVTACIGGRCGTELGAPGARGEPCFVDDELCPVEHACAPELSCDQFGPYEPVCLPAEGRAPGEPCAFAEQCESGACADVCS